jgi:hypothetical protein
MSIIAFAAGVAVGYLFPKAVYAAYSWAASKIIGAK